MKILARANSDVMSYLARFGRPIGIDIDEQDRICWMDVGSEPFTLDREARSVSFHREALGSFKGSETTTLWHLDLEDPQPEPLALAFMLLWIHWDSLIYARSMI